jgi:hypothetical protein
VPKLVGHGINYSVMHLRPTSTVGKDGVAVVAKRRKL